MASNDKKKIDLALQGGGSHGALTWGVLDRLLEDDRIEIEAISGTSAGAMNAVVVADGINKGGRDGARQALRDFWLAISDAARFSPVQRGFWDRLLGNDSLDLSPFYVLSEHLTQLASPAMLNPLGINPLRDLIDRTIDFEQVNSCKAVKVFVTATNVRTGRAKVFSQPHITTETLLASACLPNVFPTVEIDGEAYWDGGYSGNPALYPLVDDCAAQDLVVVQINPLRRQQLPSTARDIINRINEITFNTSLIKELRSIQLLQQLIEAQGVEPEQYRAMRLHLIHAEHDIEALSASSKVNTEWSFLKKLHGLGREWADAWLDEHFDALGKRSTLDLDSMFTDTFRPCATSLTDQNAATAFPASG